jgi:NAD(P)-dependent dehydrogenase (short-subunit alcohol dehydrogenase family)
MRPSAGDVRGRLAGRTGIVTGVGTGIGRGIARLFADAGAALVVCDVEPDLLADAAADLRGRGVRVEEVAGDVADPRLAEEMVARAAALGGPDFLVNNAARYATKPLLETTDEDWDGTLAATLDSVFYFCRAAVRAMVARGGGSIVNIASVNQIHANPNLPAYTAAKAGVRGLTMQIAVQYGPQGVRANAISPGLVVTERNGPAMSDFDVAMNVEAYPVGRLGAPGDVAHAALFLASDASAWISGADLPVDGGLSALAASAMVSPKVRRWYGRKPLRPVE